MTRKNSTHRWPAYLLWATVNNNCIQLLGIQLGKASALTIIIYQTLKILVYSRTFIKLGKCLFCVSIAGRFGTLHYYCVFCLSSFISKKQHHSLCLQFLIAGMWGRGDLFKNVFSWLCILNSSSNNTYQYHVLNCVQEQMFGMFQATLGNGPY